MKRFTTDGLSVVNNQNCFIVNDIEAKYLVAGSLVTINGEPFRLNSSAIRCSFANESLYFLPISANDLFNFFTKHTVPPNG